MADDELEDGDDDWDAVTFLDEDLSNDDGPGRMSGAGCSSDSKGEDLETGEGREGERYQRKDRRAKGEEREKGKSNEPARRYQSPS